MRKSRDSKQSAGPGLELIMERRSDSYGNRRGREKKCLGSGGGIEDSFVGLAAIRGENSKSDL